MARAALFKSLHLSTLLLVLGHVLVSLAIGGGAGGDGSLLLLSGLAEHNSQTADFVFIFAALALKLEWISMCEDVLMCGRGLTSVMVSVTSS